MDLDELEQLIVAPLKQRWIDQIAPALERSDRADDLVSLTLLRPFIEELSQEPGADRPELSFEQRVQPLARALDLQPEHALGLALAAEFCAEQAAAEFCLEPWASRLAAMDPDNGLASLYTLSASNDQSAITAELVELGQAAYLDRHLGEFELLLGDTLTPFFADQPGLAGVGWLGAFLVITTGYPSGYQALHEGCAVEQLELPDRGAACGAVSTLLMNTGTTMMEQRRGQAIALALERVEPNWIDHDGLVEVEVRLAQLDEYSKMLDLAFCYDARGALRDLNRYLNRDGPLALIAGGELARMKYLAELAVPTIEAGRRLAQAGSRSTASSHRFQTLSSNQGEIQTSAAQHHVEPSAVDAGSAENSLARPRPSWLPWLIILIAIAFVLAPFALARRTRKGPPR